MSKTPKTPKTKEQQFSEAVILDHIPCIGMEIEKYCIPYFRYVTHVRYLLLRQDGIYIIPSANSLN